MCIKLPMLSVPGKAHALNAGAIRIKSCLRAQPRGFCWKGTPRETISAITHVVCAAIPIVHYLSSLCRTIKMALTWEIISTPMVNKCLPTSHDRVGRRWRYCRFVGGDPPHRNGGAFRPTRDVPGSHADVAGAPQRLKGADRGDTFATADPPLLYGTAGASAINPPAHKTPAGAARPRLH